MALTVSVVSRTETLWSGEAQHVSVPSVEGDVGILPGRQPLLAVLRPGTVVITGQQGNKDQVQVGEGFASFDRDHVMVVVDDPVSA